MIYSGLESISVILRIGVGHLISKQSPGSPMSLINPTDSESERKR